MCGGLGHSRTPKSVGFCPMVVGTLPAACCPPVSTSQVPDVLGCHRRLRLGELGETWPLNGANLVHALMTPRWCQLNSSQWRVSARELATNARVVNVVADIGARLLKTKGALSLSCFLRGPPISCAVARDTVRIYSISVTLTESGPGSCCRTCCEWPGKCRRREPWVSIPPGCRCFLWTCLTGSAFNTCPTSALRFFLHASISATATAFCLYSESPSGDDICRCLIRAA